MPRNTFDDKSALVGNGGSGNGLVSSGNKLHISWGSVDSNSCRRTASLGHTYLQHRISRVY